MASKRMAGAIVAGGVLLLIGALALAGAMAARSDSFNIPFVKVVRERGVSIDVWSIGIYAGKDPFHLDLLDAASNPVLTADQVSDVPAQFVADPFMVYENGLWHMFFEVLNADTQQGDIAFATSSDGLAWQYEQVVLDEPFHLSYPYVFQWKDEYFMIPESNEASSIRLYKATHFPESWAYVKTLVEGRPFADSSIFRHDDRWWIFTETNPRQLAGTLRLYYADDLMGPWSEHPESPLIEGNANIARPGGRVITFDGKLLRMTQDDDPTYGNQVRAFVIDVLTLTDYREHEAPESPILETTASPSAWNTDGMHHVDAHQVGEGRWLACVDGFNREKGAPSGGGLLFTIPGFGKD